MKSSAGIHIVLDGFVKDPAVFTSDILTATFKQLAESLEMKIIMGPDFLEVPLNPTKLQSDVFQDEGGITGMCVISTSHMSIHCWPIRKCFSMDVFSCKAFDSDKAKQIIWDLLGVESGDYTVVNRTFPEATV